MYRLAWLSVLVMSSCAGRTASCVLDVDNGTEICINESSAGYCRREWGGSAFPDDGWDPCVEPGFPVRCDDIDYEYNVTLKGDGSPLRIGDYYAKSEEECEQANGGVIRVN